MSHITTEQALQIPQQLQRQGSNGGSNSPANPQEVSSQEAQRKGILSDDAVTLMRFQPQTQNKKIEVEGFKNALGHDNAFVKETLKAKLAEYNLNPNTQIRVQRDMFGNIEIKGAILQSDIENITNDLNNSQAFKDAFSRLSQQQPTLNYVDNVVKLNKAYGVSNSLFNSLVSEESEFNGLSDISHRYEAMRATTPVDQAETVDNLGFNFVLNG